MGGSGQRCTTLARFSRHTGFAMIYKTVEATVKLVEDDYGTFLAIGDDPQARIWLNHSPGQDIHDFFKRNVLEKARPAGQKLGRWSKRTIAYTTGAFALLIVSVSAVAALIYAATHGTETLTNLATSTLTGIGMAIGGCLGSALILRFKAARKFLRSVLKDLQ